MSIEPTSSFQFRRIVEPDPEKKEWIGVLAVADFESTTESQTIDSIKTTAIQETEDIPIR